jgi:exodeoxyribonuclease VII small subunit
VDAARKVERKVKKGEFEDAVKRLGKIVESLESGELSLDESLKLFEEGIKLARGAQEKLDHAEKRIEELLSVDQDGNAKTAPFEV